MRDAQARVLRRDLQQWMVKFRFSALMSGPEIVINYGEAVSLDREKVLAARVELRQLTAHHLGARGPSGGNATSFLSATATAAAAAAAAALAAAPAAAPTAAPPAEAPAAAAVAAAAHGGGVGG